MVNLKRSPMKPRSKPLPPGKPLSKGKALQRAAIVRTAAVARSVTPSARKAKTRVGEFPPKTRRLAYERFHGRCAWCGDLMHPQAFTVQHRRARGQGGSRDPLTVSLANGVAVHQLPCHEYIEAHPAAATVRGFRVAQGTDPAGVPVLLWDGRTVWLANDGTYVPHHEES